MRERERARAHTHTHTTAHIWEPIKNLNFAILKGMSQPCQCLSQQKALARTGLNCQSEGFAQYFSQIPRAKHMSKVHDSLLEIKACQRPPPSPNAAPAEKAALRSATAPISRACHVCANPGSGKGFRRSPWELLAVCNDHPICCLRR